LSIPICGESRSAELIPTNTVLVKKGSRVAVRTRERPGMSVRMDSHASGAPMTTLITVAPRETTTVFQITW
jgi:hypothetical protein